MKFFLMAALAMTTLFGQQSAFAAPPAEDLYHLSIAGSAGLRTFASNRICEGAGGCTNCSWWSGGGESCGPGLSWKGNDKSKSWSCCRCVIDCAPLGMEDLTPEELTIIEAQEKAQEAELEDVFGHSERTDYWGYYNSTNRSPSGGRGNSVEAKLDACLNHTNWDPSGSYASCVSACNDGSKNAHCAANGAEVCLDRCECKYAVGTCNNL